MKNSTFLNYSFAHKKVLLRVDYNVPLDSNGNITDDTRIKETLPTLNKILKDGGSIILLSHLGRPKGVEKKYSLRPVQQKLNELLKKKVLFSEDCIGKEAMESANHLKKGEILLLENLRFHKEEEDGNKDFAEQLAKLGDIWVNDAFATAHRSHASTAVMGRFFSKDKKMFGLLMEKEIAFAEKVFHNATSPFVAIIGGAKISDKILIIENLLNKVNHLIIGGGMAYTFIKAKGGKIGKSICEVDMLTTAEKIMKLAKEKNISIHLPIDSLVSKNFSDEKPIACVKSDAIPDGLMGLDIGEQAIADFTKIIQEAKTILWNGPMGVFEMKNYQEGTKKIAEAVANTTQMNNTFSLVGGGDSVAAIHQFHLADKVSFVSTGGGALLEFFEGKELPGIVAVKN